MDSLATLFAPAARQHQEEIEGRLSPQAQAREHRILNEAKDPRPLPTTPQGWLGATIVIASSDISLPARSRAAVQPEEQAERARVRSLEWDDEEEDFLATLEYEQPANQQREGVFTEVMLFEDLAQFQRIQGTREQTDHSVALPPQSEQDDGHRTYKAK